MDYCIYDRNDACTHDCADCTAHKLRCASCGTEDGELYESDGDLFCADCLVEETGSEYYAGFAETMESDFRDYVISANRENRVRTFGQDEDMY